MAQKPNIRFFKLSNKPATKLPTIDGNLNENVRSILDAHKAHLDGRTTMSHHGRTVKVEYNKNKERVFRLPTSLRATIFVIEPREHDSSRASRVVLRVDEYGTAQNENNLFGTELNWLSPSFRGQVKDCQSPGGKVTPRAYFFDHEREIELKFLVKKAQQVLAANPGFDLSSLISPEDAVDLSKARLLTPEDTLYQKVLNISERAQDEVSVVLPDFSQLLLGADIQ